MQEKRNLPKWLRWLPFGARQEAPVTEPEPEPQPQSAVEEIGAGLGMSLQRGSKRARVLLTGELDLSNAHRFAARLAEAEADEPEVIEIDVRGLSFIDSSGLRELFAANRRARESNRRLLLIKDSGPIERVLNLARVEDVIDVLDLTAN
jgi:anti-anti-sigma factor